MKRDGLQRMNADLRATRGGRMQLERARVWVEATERLCGLMNELGVTQAELARRLGVSRPVVHRMLSGDTNLTLGTLADAFFVLGRAVHVEHGPPSAAPRMKSPARARPTATTRVRSTRARSKR